MAAPADLRFTRTHEWVRVEGDVATLGITDHAQSELGDITYIELPGSGETVGAGDPFGVVESVKAASDIYSPIDGEVIDRNESAIETPELLNQSPYERAWLLKVRVSESSQIDGLMSARDYDTFAEGMAR